MGRENEPSMITDKTGMFKYTSKSLITTTCEDEDETNPLVCSKRLIRCEKKDNDYSNV